MNLNARLRTLRDKKQEFLLNSIAASLLIPMKWRRRIYKSCGIELDDRSGPLQWWSGCEIYGPQISGVNIRVQSDTYIGSSCTFYGGASISIGKRCNIGKEVAFCTSTHEISGPQRRAGAPRAEPITVGDGCWIGTRATILPGVNIGEGCIIAAGALVNKDCEPNGLFAGVPAKRIRDL